MILLPSLGGGGAEHVAIILANSFGKKGYLVNLTYCKPYHQLASFVSNSVTVHCLNSKRVIYATIKIVLHILKYKPDVVLAIDGSIAIPVGFFRLLFDKKTKIAFRECTIPSLYYNNIKGIAIKKIYPYLLNKFDIIISQSKDMLDDLHTTFKVPYKKLFVINNPISTTKIKLAKPLYLERSSSVKKRFLAVGNLVFTKGYDRLLKIFSLLDRKAYQLIILGDGSDKEALFNMSIDLGIEKEVIFMGYRENRFEYMKASDLFLMTSRFEGFPNALIEALACGLPSIVFRCKGGINEIINDGINGFSVPDGDLNAFVQAINLAMTFNFNTNLIAIQTMKKYSLEYITKKYENVLFNYPKS